MCNSLPIPEPRVVNNQILQKSIKKITAMKLNLHLSMSLIVAAQTTITLTNKAAGVYRNPEDYLFRYPILIRLCLIDYSKSLNQGQKVAIVTGANSGIGSNNWIACRNEQKAQEAIEKIKLNKNDKGELKFIQFNADSLRSVGEFASEFGKLNKKLDLLINNAGIMMVPYSLTKDGVESQIGTNFLSHYFLTDQLMSYLCNNAKIINLSSLASFFVNEFSLEQLTDEEVYSPVENYCQSKLAMTMFTYYLNSRLQDNDITVYSVNPGMVKTNLYTSNTLTKATNLAAGAFTTLRCALLPPPENHGAETLYYSDELPFYPPTSAIDESHVKELIGWAKDIITARGFSLKSDL
ncbi:NAD(P)-binding protein [Conidiobolus coronatus NRRL 28638]|uniref:NAD(P)-binding protein n=1 Tax=Conidiobolus coronatus (strain ATCC 28846 / CBS 209.66 / NRRL 28638) TaxID=796925 RepID=A0A137P8K6_CONC2|nr:NAD(P)-binding protein [Conidiobolus coronatus NRRL 28638]|eukprot:KXN71261.1 NAD(P)-binding protein [Conidiobolus coronatus NRRL 28638]